jgi:hypothetical protein
VFLLGSPPPFLYSEIQVSSSRFSAEETARACPGLAVGAGGLGGSLMPAVYYEVSGP